MIGAYLRELWESWNRFWFTPTAADTLSALRILVGSMLVYTHLVWSIDLEAFFSHDLAAIPPAYRTMFSVGTGMPWSHFDWLDSAAWLWGSHVFAIIVFAAFTIGFWTRLSSVLAFLFVVSYANRATGALFGLDQINSFLTLYLAISNCGAKYSVDQLLARGQGQGRGVVTVSNNIATRLIQLHLCVVYLFAGLGKLQGTTWWNGEAIWGTIASYEYQTMDLTWMAGCLWLVNILTYIAVAWEVSYPFMIWSRLTRPIYLGVAVLVHLGIGIAMGMLTFGLIMIWANLIFIRPEFTRKIIERQKQDDIVQNT